MLSLFPVACSKFGASSLKAEVSATDVNTLISAALLATAANKHDINPPAMRFANAVWIMHPSHEINFSYSITSSARSREPGEYRSLEISGFQVDYQLKVSRKLQRQFGRLGTFQYLVDGVMKIPIQIDAVTNDTSCLDVLAVSIDRR